MRMIDYEFIPRITLIEIYTKSLDNIYNGGSKKFK